MKSIILTFVALSFFISSSCWSGVVKSELPAHIDPDYEKRKIHEVMSDSDHQDKVHINGAFTGKAKCGTFVFKDEHGKEIHIRVEADEIPDKGLLFSRT